MSVKGGGLTQDQLEQLVDSTLAEVDTAGEGFINKSEYRALCQRQSSVLDMMTLPQLSELTSTYPSFVFNSLVNTDRETFKSLYSLPGEKS